jgi:excisionase family DNA binding protein
MSEADEKTAVAPAWLSYSQAASYATLSRTTLWQLIRAGEIKAARIGRAVRIERDSLEKYMQNRATQLRLFDPDEIDS